MKHVALALFVSAVSMCGCEKGVDPLPGAAPVEGHYTPVADATAFADRLRTRQDAVLGVIGGLEYTAMIKLLGVSGVEQELGGPAATDAALQSLMRQNKNRIAGPQPLRFMPVQNSQSVEGALGVAQASVELMSVALSFKDLYGDGQAGKKAWTFDKSNIEFEVADGALSYASALTTSEKGLDGKFLTQMKVNVCPSPEGRIELEVTSKSELSRAGSGANITIKVIATRTLDDDAQFAAIDLKTHVESTTFGAHAGAFVDLDISREGTRVNRRSSQATDADASNAADLARILELMASAYTEQTRSVWESGACVKLDPRTTPSQRLKVKPSSSFSIFAAPRSKVDGSPVGGTVRGTLNGGTSLDPGGTRARADVTYSYTAPDEKKAESRVSLESRSKRGVGKAEVVFSTEGEGGMYSASGGADEFHGTGEICDLAQQFFIEGSGVTVRFEPSTEAGGRYSYSGNMSGFAVYGNGTYQVKFDGDVAVSITATGPGSVKTPMGTQTRTGSEQYQLTPNEGGSCT
jgi:hypothetical protein